MRKKTRNVSLKLKKGKGGKPLPTTEPMDFDSSGGPGEIKMIDPLKMKKKKDNLYKPEKFSLGVEKVTNTALNKYMIKKSAFDTLYEEVMDNPADISPDPMGGESDDLEALDIDTDEGEDTEGDVTFTLPRDVAQQLHDVLMSALDSDMDMGEEDEFSDEELGAEDLGADIDDDFEDEGEDNFGENVEVQPEPKAIEKGKGTKMMSKGNMKAALNSRGKASGQAKVDVEPQPKPHKGKDMTGKDNKVGNLKTGHGMFD